MNTILSSLGDALSAPAMPFAVEVFVKSTIILLAALILVHFLKKSAASLRHITLAAAFAALLALPFFVLLGPPFQISINKSLIEGPDVRSSEHVAIPYAPIPDPNPGFALPGTVIPPATPFSATKGQRTEVFPGPSQPAVAVPSESAPAVSWGVLAFYLWLAGVVFVLFKVMMGYLAVKWLSRRAVPVRDSHLTQQVETWRRAYQITRPVTVVKSIYAIMPMTWGALRPTVMLPSDASEWSSERKRVVLLHELAHIKRFDWLIQMIAQIACAVYWFNPLVWKAAAELRRERELACDEAVLDAGARASDYAQHLLDIARSGSAPRYAPQAALAMARPSQLESRLRAILDPRRRSSTRQRNAIAVFLAVAVAVPLLAARPMLVDDALSAESTAVRSGDFSHWPGLAPQHAPVPHPNASPAHSEEPALAPAPVTGRDFQWSGTIARGNSIEIKGANGSIRAMPASGNEVEVTAVKSGRRDGSSESVRIEVLEHHAGVTICAVYPGTEQRCVPGPGGGQEAMNNDVHVNFSVAVPAGVGFIGRTVNGNVSAIDMRSRVDAHAVNGNVRVSSSEYVLVNTVNGNIDVSMGRSDLISDMSIKTVNGMVKVGIPPAANLDVHATLVNGRISSDFETVRVERGEVSGSSARGRIGSGGPVLTIEAVNGNIALERASNAVNIRGAEGNPHGVPAPNAVARAAGNRVSSPPPYGMARQDAPGGSVRLAFDEQFRAEIDGMVAELVQINKTLADSVLHAERRRELQARSERLEAMIEERAERLAAMVEARMAVLQPLIEEKALVMTEEVLVPMMDKLERELPALMDKLERELPALLDEIIESVSRSFRQD